jgi:predicted nucleic acid-binding protein
MTVVDTDIFVIAALHPEDPRSAVNGRFVELMREHRGVFATTIFNKLEMVGVCSFGMSRSQLRRLWDGFEERFGVVILFPSGILSWQEFAEAVRSHLHRQMKLGDALVLMVAESHPEVDTFVTWNAKHFRGKTHLSVLTPSEFLRRKG